MGVELTNLTGGVYDATTLLQGDNAVCLHSRCYSKAPRMGLLLDMPGTESKLTTAVVNVLSGVSCLELEHCDVSQFEQFPGAKEAVGASK